MKMKRAFLITVLVLSLAVVSASATDLIVPTSPGSIATSTASITITRIDQYIVAYSSNTFIPRIWLYNSSGGGIGQLLFKPDGSTLPSDYITSWGEIGLYYHLADYQNCLDLLRNQNPVYLVWSGSGGENAIQSGIAPVGEGENAPALTVTSPNGGQNWTRSSIHTITWKAVANPGAYVKIELLKGGVLNRVISYSTENDGTYSWTISSTQIVGTDYKIRITSTSMTPITDSSDYNFIIS